MTDHNTKRLHDELGLYKRANDQQLCKIKEYRRKCERQRRRADAWEANAKQSDEALQNAVAEIEKLRERLAFLTA